LVHRMVVHIGAGEVEERILLQQRVFHAIGLERRNLDIGRDAAPAVDGAAAVGQLDFLIIGRGLFAFAVVIIIVERNTGVFTLNQASTGRVVLGGGQGQGGIFRKRIDGLNQALAKSG